MKCVKKSCPCSKKKDFLNNYFRKLWDVIMALKIVQ